MILLLFLFDCVVFLNPINLLINVNALFEESNEDTGLPKLLLS